MQKDEGGSRYRQIRQERQANWRQLAHGDRCNAAFFASELCTECGWFHGEYHPDAADPFCVLPESRGHQALQQTETWFINMIGPAQRSLVVASLDGAEYALLDSGSGLTSCAINLTTFHYCRGPTTFRP